MGDIINRDVPGFLMKLLIDQHCKAVDFIHIIRFFWFVQNHRQGRTRSAAALKKDPNRGDLLILEIIFQNVIGFF